MFAGMKCMTKFRALPVVAYFVLASCTSGILGDASTSTTAPEPKAAATIVDPFVPFVRSLTARTVNFDLPDGWQVAESSLTPNLGSPREILSIGTFPMVVGGDTCAQVPEAAMEALGPQDVLVSLQERSQVDASFAPRPTSFAPLLGGIALGDAFECVDQNQRADIGTLLWLPFREVGRGFYLIVVMGTDVSDEVRDQTVAMLDSLDFGT